LLAALAPAARAQFGMGLSPLRLEIALGAGMVHSGQLTLTNESEKPIRVRSEMLDFYIDDTGTPQFAREYPAEAPYSCRTWLSLNPRETELPAKSSMTVRYTLRVPDGLEPRSFHCAAGFTTQPTADQVGAMGVRAAVRMVAAFYVLIGEPVVEGEIEDVTLEPLKNESTGWQAVVVLRNWGHKYFRPAGGLELLDENGSVVETHSFPSLPVLPNRRQRFLFPLKTSPETGPYRLRVRVDFGGAEILQTTVTLRLPEVTP